MSKTFLYLATILICFSCCEKQNLKRAEKSLTGNWKVVKIHTEFTEKADPATEEITEEGDLGIFMFNKSTVDYKFTRLDTLYEGNEDWEISREKVNEGFVKIERYTLTIDDKSYICKFGDVTKDAEKNATEINLEQETEETGPYESIMLWLEKK